MKRILLILISFSCLAEQVPDDFKSFYTINSSAVTVILNGRSINVGSKFHIGFFSIEKQDAQVFLNFLADEFSPEIATNITKRLVAGIDIPNNCQYLDRICTTKKNDINARVDVSKKVVNIFLGESFYDIEELKKEFINITETELSSVSKYNLYYNLNDNGKTLNGDVYSTFSMGDKSVNFEYLMNEDNLDLKSYFIKYDNEYNSLGLGYLSPKELNAFNNNFLSISSGSDSYYGFFYEKNADLLKKTGKSNNTIVVFAPSPSTLLTVKKDGKVILIQEIDSGLNDVDISRLPSGRYSAEFELTINGNLYEKYTKVIVNNTRSKLKVGEYIYSTGAFYYDSGNTKDDSLIVGKLGLTSRLTDTIDLSGILFSGGRRTIISGRMDYYYTDGFNVGNEVSFLNEEPSSIAIDAEIHRKLKLNYTRNYLNKNQTHGYTSNFIRDESSEYSLSLSQKISNFNTMTTLGSISYNQSQKTFFNSSISRNFKHANISIGGNYNFISGHNDTFSVNMTVVIPLNHIKSTLKMFSLYSDKNITHTTEFVNKIYDSKKIKSEIRAGYSHNKYKQKTPHLAVTNNFDGNYTESSLNAMLRADYKELSGTFNGAIIATKNNISLTSARSGNNSYILFDSREIENDSLFTTIYENGNVYGEHDISDNNIINVENYEEYIIDFSLANEGFIFHSPIKFDFTSGYNSVFEISPITSRTTLFSGFSEEKNITCKNCIEFGIDDYGFFLGKSLSNEVFSIDLKNMICKSYKLKHSDFVHEIGEVKCVVPKN